MVKPRMPSLAALAAGLLAVLLHPSKDTPVVLGLCAYVAAGFLVPAPLLRFLLPIVGTVGFDAFCMAAFATRFNNEVDFAPFVLASTAWAALLGAGSAAAPRRSALAAGLSAAAAAAAFATMTAIDRFVALYAPFSRRDAFADPLHLTQVVMCALAFFLAVWLAVVWTRRRRKGKLLAYAEGYTACRRELDALGRKFPW